MARKKDVFDFFKEREGQLSESPSAHTWRRLERRLDTHQQRNRRSFYRALAMAGGVLLLALAVVLITLALEERIQQGADHNAAPSQLEDLPREESQEERIHTVQAAQQAQEKLRRPITEGITGQKLMLANAPSAAAPMNASPNRLNNFEWMLGRWQAREQGEVLVEEWKRSSKNVFEGMASLEGSDSHPERMRLILDGQQLFFTTDFGGEEPVSYTLVALNGQEALFENLDQDFPQQVRFLRQGRGQLLAIYQNSEAEQQDSERLRALSQRHTLLPQQAIRRLSRLSLQ